MGMKVKIMRVRKILQNMLISLAFVFAGFAYAAPESIGYVIIATPGMKAVNPDVGEDRVLQRKSLIYKGDKLVTMKGGKAQVKLTEGSIISMRGDTVYRIDEYRLEDVGAKKAAISSSLLKGGLRSLSGRLSKRFPNSFKVKTPVATIGIRGTHYNLKLDKQGLAAGVQHGNIEVSNNQGSVLIGNGMSDSFAFVGIGRAPVSMKTAPASLYSSAYNKQLLKQRFAKLKALDVNPDTARFAYANDWLDRLRPDLIKLANLKGKLFFNKDPSFDVISSSISFTPQTIAVDNNYLLSLAPIERDGLVATLAIMNARIGTINANITRIAQINSGFAVSHISSIPAINDLFAINQSSPASFQVDMQVDNISYGADGIALDFDNATITVPRDFSIEVSTVNDSLPEIIDVSELQATIIATNGVMQGLDGAVGALESISIDLRNDLENTNNYINATADSIAFLFTGGATEARSFIINWMNSTDSAFVVIGVTPVFFNTTQRSTFQQASNQTNAFISDALSGLSNVSLDAGNNIVAIPTTVDAANEAAPFDATATLDRDFEVSIDGFSATVIEGIEGNLDVTASSSTDPFAAQVPDDAKFEGEMIFGVLTSNGGDAPETLETNINLEVSSDTDPSLTGNINAEGSVGLAD